MAGFEATLAALDLRFDEAIDFFRDKASVTSTGWTDVWQKANAKAFTVAGATTEALVEDFRAEVTKSLERGTTLQEFRQGFDAIVRKHGWEHVGKPGWRSRVIFETNLSMAYSAGRYAQQTEPETLAAFPYWQYVHSGAKHPRKQHLAWNGTVLRADDPFWDWAYPPNGWGCGCRVRPVSEAGLKRQGRSGVDQAPERIPTQTVTRSGEVLKGSLGVDPGFDYNPGKVWQDAPAGEVRGPVSGAQLVIRMDVSQAQSAFQRLAMAVSDTTPIMRAIGTGLVTNTQDRFDEEVDPDGAAWAPLDPVYAAGKRGAGILRESAMRGGLQGSITYRAGRHEVQVGTNKVYGAIHQFGGVINPKGSGRLVFRMGGRLVKARSVTIPARPYLGISSEDRVMILDVVTGALDRAIGSGSSSRPAIR